MDDDETARIIEAAETISLNLPPACVPGVLENDRVLDGHRELIRAFLAEHPEL